MNPLDQVIFEYTLDELMEDVRCEQFMDISSRESVCEWLKAPVRENRSRRGIERTTTSPRIPYSSQRIPGSNLLIKKSVFSCDRLWAPGSSRLDGFASHLDQPIR